MTNKQILEKTIQKAIDGGWGGSNDAEYTARTAIERYDGHRTVNDIIFNHDFAKALWNTPVDSLTGIHFRTRDGRSEWEYHLQQMVTSDDPIKYLGENI